MRIYDATMPLFEGMPVYPGDPPFRRRVVASLADGAASELGLIETGCHAGTHVDAPSHIKAGGARIEELKLDALVGPARLFDLSRIRGHIGLQHVEKLNWRGVKRAILRTRNSSRCDVRRFDESFAALLGDAAEFLASKKLLFVGIDGPSVDRFHSGTHPAHVALISAGVVIAENLMLRGIPAGSYELFCGPMKIVGGEGAPARILLIKR